MAPTPSAARQPADGDRRERAERARERLWALYSPACLLCEVRCRVDRHAGERGVCGLAETTPVYRRLVHFGEERELVPSYAVWLAGCNFLCTFCSDIDALRPPLPGRELTASALAEVIAVDLERTRHPIRNINFVGGDPGISLPYLADLALCLFERLDAVPPLLLNTNGYLTPRALEAAVDLFDVFVVDFKFGDDACARDIGAPKRYVETLTRNLAALAASGRELWVRHLLMPDHLECCTTPVLDHLARYPEARVNVMPAFVAFQGPWRSLRPDEVSEARARFEASAVTHKYWAGERL